MDFALPEIDTNDAATAGVDVPLKRLDGEPLLNKLEKPVVLCLIGSDSEAYRRAQRAMVRKRMARALKNKGKDVSDEQLAEAESDELDMLAVCVVGWKGILDSNDKPIPFSEAGAREFLRRFPIAREQADAAIVDRTRFTKASPEA